MFIITGCGTNVGKTIISAIIVEALKGAYWKPIESGVSNESDVLTMQSLLNPNRTIFKPSYQLQRPLSPHHAALKEGITIKKENISVPHCVEPLIVESAGGICVPLSSDLLLIDLFSEWKAKWIVVSKNYLGSINHTLLTVKTLQSYQIEPVGIIFNGASNPESEKAILRCSGLPCLAHLPKLNEINRKIIINYAEKWKPTLCKLLN